MVPLIMQEHHIRVDRTARYYLLGAPGGHVRRLWFVLHGYGQLAPALLRRCEPLAGPDVLVVAPEGLSRFYVAPINSTNHAQAKVGASWITRDGRELEIADYVAYLDRLHEAIVRECPGRVELRLLGFSQGVATAVRWAILGAAEPPRQMLLWAGNLPAEIWTDAARTRLSGADLVLAAGDADPYLAPGDFDRTVERARAFGYRVRGVGFSGGHVVPPELLAELSAS
jgi:predicted esterase